MLKNIIIIIRGDSILEIILWFKSKIMTTIATTFQHLTKLMESMLFHKTVRVITIWFKLILIFPLLARTPVSRKNGEPIFSTKLTLLSMSKIKSAKIWKLCISKRKIQTATSLSN